MTSDQQPELLRKLSSSNGSFELVLSAVLMGLIGFGLDRWLETTPWCTVGLSVFGLAGAVAKLYYQYSEKMGTLDAERRVLAADRVERAA
jgi:F0F1-type ATP synthase assembly protein I